MTKPPHLTIKQANWFRKVREGLERETGKGLDEWLAIARTCPETSHQKRLKWFKESHGLGINRASIIINAAFDSRAGWDNPDELLQSLWKSPETRQMYDAIEAIALSLGDDVIVGPRKTFSAFSRQYQFAAARPVKGVVRLGLALDGSEQKLARSRPRESWSDRLGSVVIVSSIDEIDDNITRYMRSAYERS